MRFRNVATAILGIFLMLFSFVPVASANFMSPGRDGLRDLQLLFVGWPLVNGDVRQYSWDEMKKYVAHINRNSGSADGFMFRQFLFLEMAGSSGRAVVSRANSVGAGQQTDWDEYTDQLFLSGYNLNALYTTATYNGYGNTTLDVWINLPYPDPYSHFNGGTTYPFSCNDTARVNAVKAWIDNFLSRWHMGDRLRLRGFYWGQESVYYTNTNCNDDARVMQQVNSYVHSKTADGYYLKSLWIPYYKANGWSNWSANGFNDTFLQPHWYFQADGQTASITGAASDAEAYGMGIEMEYDQNVLNDSTRRREFVDYLNGGVTEGYMTGSAHAWYDGYKSLLKLYDSGDSLYDDIYHFTQGTYQNSAQRTVTSVSVSPSNASLDVGSGRQFTATATFSDGSTSQVSATWTTDNESVASVDSNGYVTAISPGSTWVNAEYGGYSDFAGIDVASSAGTGFSNAIPISSSTSGTVSQGQDIYYQFQGSSGTTYTVSLVPSSGDPDLYVYNPSQSSIGSSTKGTGSTDQVTFTASASGTHYIKVHGYAAASFTLSISSSGGSCTLGSSFDCPLNLDTSPSGSVPTGENVYYRFYAEAGTSNTVTLVPSSGDPDLYVYDPNQSRIGSSANGTGSTDQVTFTASTTGYYYAKVYGYSSASYTISH